MRWVCWGLAAGVKWVWRALADRGGLACCVLSRAMAVAAMRWQGCRRDARPACMQLHACIVAGWGAVKQRIVAAMRYICAIHVGLKQLHIVSCAKPAVPKAAVPTAGQSSRSFEVCEPSFAGTMEEEVPAGEAYEHSELLLYKARILEEGECCGWA